MENESHVNPPSKIALNIHEFLIKSMVLYPLLSTRDQAVVVNFTYIFCERVKFLHSPSLKYVEEMTWLVEHMQR
jgi:hypothetical protein